MMTRKDYKVIAQTIAKLNTQYGCNPISIELLARELSKELPQTNPRFNSSRFLTACGVK